MATSLTVSAFYTELDNSTNSKFSGVSNARKLAYLNMALINRYQELINLVPSVYDKQSSLTFASTGYTVALPTDMNADEVDTDYHVFHDTNYSPENVRGGKNVEFWIEGGNLRFNYQHNSGDIEYISYTKEPSNYTAVTDTLSETASLKAKQILKYEVEAIRDSDKAQGQATASYQNAQIKANNLY